MIHTSHTDQPDHILHFLMEGAQEMLGLDRLAQVFELPAGANILPAFKAGLYGPHNGADSCSVAGLSCALEQRYGAAGGRGLALRIGRSTFKYLLQRRGDAIGLTSLDFRLQRAPQRMKSGLHLLAQQLMNDSGDLITIHDEAQHWVWRSERCPECWGRNTGEACCYLTVGFLQAFMAWAGSGRYYRVIESECRSAGALACSFRIEKKPLD